MSRRNLIHIIIFVIYNLTLSYSFANDDDNYHRNFIDWDLYSTNFLNDKICYIISAPIESIGNYRRKGSPYIIVSRQENENDEIIVSSGYNYKKNTDLEILFKRKKFKIRPFDNLAWAKSKNQDIDIIKEMKKNKEMIIYGINIYNRFSKDRYSLIGFKNAYYQMQSMCK